MNYLNNLLQSLMASYYDKILYASKKTVNERKHSKRLISLDDSLADEDQKPNIFNDSNIDGADKITEPKKVEKTSAQGKKKNQQSQYKNQKKDKKQNSEVKIHTAIKTSPDKSKPNFDATLQSKQEKFDKDIKHLVPINNYEQQQIIQEETEVHGVSKKSWLSLFQSLNLSLGHYFYSYKFPMRRQIPIIANNLDLEREKYENGTYISESFDNNLLTSPILFFLKAIIIDNFLRISVIFWIVAIVISFIISSEEQFRPGKQIILGVFVFYCTTSFILQYLALKQRRSWVEPASSSKYKVYHYDNQNKTAQWLLVDVTELRPGNIYKLPGPTTFKPTIVPTDSILLHGPQTILQINQSQIIQYLSPLQKQERITLKEVLIKDQVIMLPLTGVIHYQLNGAEINENNIYGKFILQEPKEETFQFSYENVMLRGSFIVSQQNLLLDDNEKKSEDKQTQILAIVLETGIDSLILKTSQYPFQYRQQSKYTKIIDYILIACSILYILIVGSGILIGYIYLANQSISRGYYIDMYLDLGQKPIQLSQVVYHHIGNLIMIVPLLMRISYLVYINIVSRVVSKKLNIQIKDMNIMAQINEPEVLVTTIGSDLIKMGQKFKPLENNQQKDVKNQQSENKIIRNRSLQSVRVGKIHHNFTTTPINSDTYSPKDTDLILYFMSLALLTCNRKDPSPLEGGLIERCEKQLNLKIEKNNNIIKIAKLQVIKVFTIPSSQKYPYKIVFYRHGREIIEDIENEKNQSKQKVLCLVRGETTRLTEKINEDEGRILNEFSNRIHQEKGFHIELLGKFVVSLDEFYEIRRSFLTQNSSQNFQQYRFTIQKFYSCLEKYLLRIEPMGILIWDNPYSVLQNNLLPISSLPQFQYKLIIAPPSKSQTNPQFQSIHSITNYLLKSSKIPLREISNKIVHNYSDKDTFWALIKSERVLVLNGWDYSEIKKMLTDLKGIKRSNQKQLRLFGYIEQDQYAWVLKETHVSLSTRGDGYDLQKYSDLIITNESSLTTTDIIRRLFIYSQAYSQCINSLIQIQFSKSVLLFVIQFINFFFTWGTGLALIGSPLYLILQVGILLDCLYYLFPRLQDKIEYEIPSQKSQKKKKQIIPKQNSVEFQKVKRTPLSLQKVVKQLIASVLVGIFLTMIPVYSMTQPPTKYGTIQPKQFTNVVIHFVLYHVLVLRKVFMKPFTLSLYKIAILVIQIGVYYLGLLIVSALDYYQFKGIIWFIFEAKIIVISVFCVWMIVGTYWIAFMIQKLLERKRPIKNSYEKIQLKKDNEQLTQYKNLKVGEVVDIE